LISDFLPRVLRSIGVLAAATMPTRSMVTISTVKIILIDNLTSLFLWAGSLNYYHLFLLMRGGGGRADADRRTKGIAPTVL